VIINRYAVLAYECAGMPRHVGGLIALHRRAHPQAKHARLCNWLRFWPKERVRWIKQRRATFGVRAAGDAVHSAKRVVRPCSAAAKLLCDAFHANRDKVLRFAQTVFADRARHQGRSADLHELRQQKVPPVLGEKQADPTHSAVMGLKLEEKLKSAGVEVILIYPGRTHPEYQNSAAFLINRRRKRKMTNDERMTNPQ